MIKEEKEKLLNEILGKSRPYKDLYNESLDILKDSEHELAKILANNQKELETLTKQSFEYQPSSVTKLKNDIQKDFDITLNDELTLVRGKASKEPFDKIASNLKEIILGQDSAIDDLVLAFRRPYITGFNPMSIRNSMIVSGNNGTGRHALIRTMAKQLKAAKLELSDDIVEIDMKRYQSSSQENLFLQDMYVALNSRSSIVVFENFELAYAPYNRMLVELVLNGNFILNKRYNLVNGVLVEANAKLSSEVIDRLNGNNKYLVFITENKINKVMDAFGKQFIDKITDKINTEKLSVETMNLIFNHIMNEFILKCHSQLEIKVSYDDKFKDYILSQYEPIDGLDSITPLVDKIYEALVDIALKNSNLINVSLTANGLIKFVIDQEVINLDLIGDGHAERNEIQKELDDIVGLKEVKSYLISLEDHIKVNKIRKQKGLKTNEVSKHMIFTGNPGTGKTTIARIVSRMMKASGILATGQLVEVSRADLVGKYVGHTAPLTMSVIESALGGVLFIDEAYSLYRGKDDSFGLEAIDTIVKAMEDHRDDLIVILAGYSKEMADFLTANSGLKSRFANIINFEDYTGKELADIAEVIARNKDYKIEASAMPLLESYFNQVQAKNDATSGNGRLARNLVEEAMLAQAKRILNNPDDDVSLLKIEDFNLA
ncbi:MAG: AAA family ATPase [Erysipelotrichaceae bacterium]|nr:AAA family ATPase [Erysipelotrichaceae bacterium]